MAKHTTLIFSLFLCAACTSSKSSSAEQAPKPAESKVAAHPSAPEPSATPGAGGLAWSAGLPLLPRTPKSRMRAAEYGLDGDPQAELSVFYFGPGQGGAVDANVTRWLGQFTQADGSSTEKKAKRSERTVNGVQVTMVEATGTYSGGMAMPGAPAPTPEGDAMLLAAIAVGPQGPVFFKFVGKRTSLEAARAAFEGLIASIHPAS